jgi:transketolase N-terminal domain/subunit
VRRSLLEGADLRSLRPLTEPGGANALVACLIDGGAAQLDAEDPAWPDRDRLVATSGVAGPLQERLDANGLADAVTVGHSDGEALGLAFGLTLASRRRGSAWRTWCLLGESPEDEGSVWEVAVGVGSTAVPLVALVAGDAGPLWAAAGWTVHSSPPDPVGLLAALDHALATAGTPHVIACHR